MVKADLGSAPLVQTRLKIHRDDTQTTDTSDYHVEHYIFAALNISSSH